MKGSNIRRWGAALAVVIIAGAAYWFWHDRGTSGSGLPPPDRPAGAGRRTPWPLWRRAGAGAGGHRHRRSGPALSHRAGYGDGGQHRHRPQPGRRPTAEPSLPEGQQVKAGDLLAQIDPSQFKVALARAQGQLAKDQATLANARRDRSLPAAGEDQPRLPPELDTQQSLVVESAGTVKADEAAVASAQLQLDWTRITAPIDGRVGLKQVDIGNQISSGDTTGIVVLTQTHPIDVVFTLPESSIATVVQAQKAGKTLSVEARIAPISRKSASASC